VPCPLTEPTVQNHCCQIFFVSQSWLFSSVAVDQFRVTSFPLAAAVNELVLLELDYHRCCVEDCAIITNSPAGEGIGKTDIIQKIVVPLVVESSLIQRLCCEYNSSAPYDRPCVDISEGNTTEITRHCTYKRIHLHVHRHR